MRIVAVFYATREGHTRQIAERIATDLERRGFAVESYDVREDTTPQNIAGYAAVVLAASVHRGAHEREMVRFVKQRREQLDRMPTAFISVTFSEAGAEMHSATPEQRAAFAADVERTLAKFYDDTGWHPARVKPVAGALLYSKYNFLIRIIMNRIARKAGAGTDTSRDYDYTDWLDLDRFVDELAEEIRHPPGATPTPADA
jgi:menaquinone-dependent protoporphyrinogen oxidase